MPTTNPGYVKEIRPEFLGMHSLNAFAIHNSSSRSVMFASHFAQRLVIKGCEERRIQTGIEREFSKHTFSVKMPEDGLIVKVIQRYPRGVDQNSLNFNPETIVIYENEKTKELDYIAIPHFTSYHQFFGYENSIKDTINQLRPGVNIAKDTVFADTPAVSENGGYMYGTNMNVAFMSIPSVSEDGVMISRSALKKLKFDVFDTRVVEFGAGQFPLNLYGTPEEYKPFPDIGDYIREDGVLMMLRQYEPDLAPVEMSAYDVMEPDFTFDKGVYVRGGRGRIVDIKVIANNSSNRQLPDKMCDHINKYQRALLRYHQEIVNVERKILAERKKKFGDGKLKLSPRLHRLIVESLAVINHNVKEHKHGLNLLHRKSPIDEYRVEFVVQYEMTPVEGFKLTDTAGGKGVICRIEEDCNMPVDADGNVADIVMDSAAVISRMNIGRLYEHYMGGACRDVSKQVCKILGVSAKIGPNKLEQLDPKLVSHAYSHLMHFYRITSEQQYNFFSNQITDEEKLQHLTDIVNEGIYLYYPVDNPKDSVDVIKAVETAFKPTYGPVSYVGNSGIRSTTVEKVRIAPIYIMLLDKIGDDWSAVSSGKLQHFGVLSPMTRSEKFSYPYRNSPVRTIGETEARIFAGYCGREAIAEMMDRSNNPLTQRNVVWNILNADKPTNIKHVVDREFISLGSNRPLLLVKHMTNIAGFNLVYSEENH